MIPFPNFGNIWIFLTISLIAALLVSNRNVSAQDAETTDPPAQQESGSENTEAITAPEPVLTTEKPTTTTTESPLPTVQIAYFYQETNTMKIFDAAVDYVREYFPTNMSILPPMKIKSEAGNTAEKLCGDMKGQKPDFILDFTRQGDPSEPVKRMARGMRMPTIAATFGQEGDVKEWRGLNDMENYLIQISPPADLAVQIMRSVVDKMVMTSGVLLFDEEYEMYHKYKALLQNMPCRHLLTKVLRDTPAIRRQIDRLVHVDIANYFIAAHVDEITEYLVEASDPDSKDGPYFSDEFAWYSMSLDKGYPSCVGCRMNTSVVHMQPEIIYRSPQRKAFLDRIGKIRTTSLTELFYFDFAVDAIISVGKMKIDGTWKEPPTVPCDEIERNVNNNNAHRDYMVQLKNSFSDHAGEYGSQLDNILGGFRIMKNGWSFPLFTMKLERMEFYEYSARPFKTELAGRWVPGFDSDQLLTKEGNVLDKHVALTVFRVVTVVQAPFVYRNATCIESKKAKYAANECFTGYCIDLFKEIVKQLNFNWTIRNVSEYGYMAEEEPHEWNGMIKELQDRRADIALGALSVMAERESVVDFTVPYYDLVGISILMKKTRATTSLFKFLTVLENDVWMCILGSYFITSFIIWVYDRLSPMSYHNNSEAYPNEEDQRDFNLKECLWFCMTSLTPQGGGEAPKNLSGRIVSAIWWLFGFIIIASYTANLAAFLTVSRLDAPVESLDDLSKQYKVQYAPVIGSPAWIYFDRMSKIESRFVDVWAKMVLNDSVSDYEKAQLSVWEFPVSMKNSKIFDAMKENSPPSTFMQGVNRVLGLDNYGGTDQFALLAEATDVKYQKSINCMFNQVGEEFSRKPYAIAVQKGSPLKESFSHMILKLLNQRNLETMKETWWSDNPLTIWCPRDDYQSDGISIHNIGGVFIVIFIGIIMACFTLIFEYWWYRKRDVSEEESEMALPTPKQFVSYFACKERTEFDGDMSRNRPVINEVQPPW